MIRARTYGIVWLALMLLGAASFGLSFLPLGELQTPAALAIALVKAVLVGTYFMHLIVDWPKLYYLIFPTFILGAMFIVVLLPDIVLGWKSASAETPHAPAAITPRVVK